MSDPLGIFKDLPVEYTESDGLIQVTKHTMTREQFEDAVRKLMEHRDGEHDAHL